MPIILSSGTEFEQKYGSEQLPDVFLFFTVYSKFLNTCSQLIPKFEESSYICIGIPRKYMFEILSVHMRKLIVGGGELISELIVKIGCGI